MTLFQRKIIQDICPHCSEVITINNYEQNHEQLCPYCKQPVFWDADLQLLKSETPYKPKKSAELKKKEKTYIIFCILIVILQILVLFAINKVTNKKYDEIITELNIIESNALEYLEQSDFVKAELEINKMNIMEGLPENKRSTWEANQESLIRLLEEKSGQKIKEEPSKGIFGIFK